MQQNPFLQEAYKFYPKGVSELLPEKYYATPEYKLLRNTIESSYAKNLESWTVFFSKVKATFAQLHITPFDYKLPHNERSFPLCITLSRNENGNTIFRNLVFHISALINYYTIYQTDPLASKIDNSYASFLIDKECEAAYDTLLSIAQQTFPNHSLFPVNLINEVIPDIMYDSIGIITDKSSKILLDFNVEMTNYHAFFSSEFYYNL